MLNTQTKFTLNRAEIAAAIGKGNASGVRRSASYVMTVARNSVKTRTKRLSPAQRAARIGQPPLSRTRRFKRSILFDYADGQRQSAIIGPTGNEANPSPAAFEYGGNFPHTVKTKHGIVRTTANYSPFPTMGPALANSKHKIASFWRDSIR